MPRRRTETSIEVGALASCRMRTPRWVRFKEVAVAENRELVRAEKRDEKLRAFYIHLAIFLFVTLGLFLIDALQGGGWWIQWAAFGWGIGVFGHGIMLFLMGQWTVDRKQRTLERQLEHTQHLEHLPPGERLQKARRPPPGGFPRAP